MKDILIYYISTEIYSQNDGDEKIVLFLDTANQRREIFTSEKWLYAPSVGKSPHFKRENWQAPFHFQDVEKVW